MYLNQASKVFSVDVVVCLQVDFSQLAGPDRVVFGVELVKAVKRLSSLGMGRCVSFAISQKTSIHSHSEDLS